MRASILAMPLNEGDVRVETQELASLCLKPLESRQIPFQLQAAPELQSVAARSVVLADGSGRVQLLTGRDRFLDLTALKSETGRELRALGSNDAASVCRKLGLAELPGIPQVTGLPMWIDEALLSAQHIYLPAGQDQQWIRIERTDFARLICDCEIRNCSHPAELNVLDAGGTQPVEEAVRRFTALRIQERLADTLHVPPLPDAARRIIQLQLEPDYDLSDLTRIVESDSSLAAQVVGWANSPYYRARGEVNSVNDAIMRVLGFDMVINLALGLAVSNNLRVPASFQGGVFRYWMNSVYTAATAEALARCMPRKQRISPGMAYLSGLLHNFGVLVLAHVFPPHFDLVLAQRQANTHLPGYAVDQHVLGISTEQIAGALLESWNLPAAVHQGVRYQNAPERAGESTTYAQLLQLARQILASRVAFSSEQPKPRIEADLIHELGLDQNMVDEAIAAIVESTDDLSQMAAQLAGTPA